MVVKRPLGLLSLRRVGNSFSCMEGNSCADLEKRRSSDPKDLSFVSPAHCRPSSPICVQKGTTVLGWRKETWTFGVQAFFLGPTQWFPSPVCVQSSGIFRIFFPLTCHRNIIFISFLAKKLANTMFLKASKAGKRAEFWNRNVFSPGCIFFCVYINFEL